MAITLTEDKKKKDVLQSMMNAIDKTPTGPSPSRDPASVSFGREKQATETVGRIFKPADEIASKLLGTAQDKEELKKAGLTGKNAEKASEVLSSAAKSPEGISSIFLGGDAPQTSQETKDFLDKASKKLFSKKKFVEADQQEKLDMAVEELSKVSKKEMTGGEIFARSLIALAPALVGYAMVGNVGIAAGGEAGVKGLEYLDKAQEKEKESAESMAKTKLLLQKERQKEAIQPYSTMEEKLGESQIDLAMLKQKQAAKDSSLYDALTEKLALEIAKAKATQGMMEVPTPRADASQKPSASEKSSPSEFKAAGFAKRAILSEQKIQAVIDQGFNRADYGTAFQSALPNAARSSLYKQYQQAEDEFIMAVKRDESGAAVKESEREEYSKLYFPRAGDSQEVIEQKRLSREQKIAELQAEAGGAFEKIKQVSIAPKVPALTKEVYDKMSKQEALEYKAADAKRKAEIIKQVQGRK